MNIIVHIPVTLTLIRSDDELRHWLGLDDDDPIPTKDEIIQHIIDEIEAELGTYLDEADVLSCGDAKVEITT